MEPLTDSILLIIKMTLVTVVATLLYLWFPGTITEMSALSWPLAPPKTVSDPYPEELYVASAAMLIDAPGVDAVKKQCLGCHSARLIVQNRMESERWRSTIRWMQKTQGLWNLGQDEEKIVQYLGTHYAPDQSGRRAPLNVAEIQWYILDQTTD